MRDINLQLYSVRAYTEKDFRGSLNRVKQCGFKGVEFAGYGGVYAKQMKQWLDEEELKAVSSHVDVFNNLDAELEYLHILGAENIVLPYAPFESEDDVLSFAEQMNIIGEKCFKEGVSLAYHNHRHEFRKNSGGKYLLDVFYENTDPKYVKAQLDIGWAFASGADPAELLKKYAERSNTAHLKEMASLETFCGAVLGGGMVDFKAVYNILKDECIYIVEQENSDIDDWESLKLGVDYLTFI